MAALTSLITVKQFTYRDDPLEQWSNRYSFHNSPPGDDASWLQLANDFIAIEKLCVHSNTTYAAAWGYNDDAEDAHAVWSHDFIAAGNPPTGSLVGSTNQMAGDQAALIVWRLDHRNSKGKPIYLRKYFHGGNLNPTDADELDTGYVSVLSAFADKLDTRGTNPFYGGIRARTGNWPVVEAGARLYVTTRTLKRRGKRPLAH